MHITSLAVENFRNYEKEYIELCPTTNVFYGDNAQGKTNLLEAVYLFSYGRSHRARTDNELIKFGKNSYKAELSFSDSQRDYKAVIRCFKEHKKQIKINNVYITKLSMLLNYFNVVMFSPEDLGLIKGAPSDRRRFVDSAISQLYPKYFANLINYNKTLLEKNSLLKKLKQNGVRNDVTLSVWNEQLAEYGTLIYNYRREFLNTLKTVSKPIHKEISNEDFDIVYTPGLKIGENDTKEHFYNLLEEHQSREIDMGASVIGVQRDDFKTYINGKEARIFGSQGQQRTCVLTLKMAQTEHIKSVKEEYPVLLFDDIMSELDINRRKYLWERITDKQVLLTCTDTDILKSTDNTKLFKISDGRIFV